MNSFEIHGLSSHLPRVPPGLETMATIASRVVRALSHTGAEVHK